MGHVTEHRAAVERVVRDHAGWVFATAKRRVRDAALAEDVAQAVFLLYWRKGAGIGSEGRLTGWLYRAVRYCSANALRLKDIRERHEREAAMERKEAQSAQWSEVEPELEGAMDRLSEKNRQAIVLRFYRGLSLREVGAAMGLGEDAARMRVERAVEKLRDKLMAKGVEVEAGALGAMVLAYAGKGDAAGLAERVVQGLGGGVGYGMAGGIAKGAGRMMALARLKVVAPVAIALVGAAIWASAAEPGTRPTRPPVVPAEVLDGRSILSQIASPQRAIANLQVEFVIAEELRPADATEWQKSSRYAAGTGWFRSLRNGQGRMALAKYVLPWEGGTASWYEEACDVSYDGQVGRYISHREGAAGKTSAARYGEVSAKSNGTLSDSFLFWGTGRGFCTEYMSFNSTMSVGEVMRDQLQRGRRLRFVAEQVNGRASVRWTVGDPRSVQQSYWFDPARGYALLKYERIAEEERPPRVERAEVLSLVEAAPGIWYPTEAIYEHPTVATYEHTNGGTPPGPIVPTVPSRWHYRASKVVVNDPSFDETALTVPIPDGYRIWDKVRDRRYVAGR